MTVTWRESFFGIAGVLGMDVIYDTSGWDILVHVRHFQVMKCHRSGFSCY